MYTILTFSYLLLPVLMLLYKPKVSSLALWMLGFYGLAIFLSLYLDTPEEYALLFAVLYTSFEYLCFSIFILLNLKSTSFKVILAVLSLSFIAFEIVFYLSHDTIGRLDTISIGVESILLFIIGIMYFAERFKKEKPEAFTFDPCFWVVSGILIYLGGAFFVYILVNDMQRHEVEQFMPITYVSELLKNIMLCIAIVVYKINTRTPTASAPPYDPSIPHLI